MQMHYFLCRLQCFFASISRICIHPRICLWFSCISPWLFSSPFFRRQDEILAECARGRLLVTIDDGVYDLTEFAERHPGGALALQHAAGQQVGDLFAEYHPSSTYDPVPRPPCPFQSTPSLSL
jgi:hypothetical protein